MFAVREFLPGLRYDWQFAFAGWRHWGFDVLADAVEISIEEAGPAIFAEEDQGVRGEFEPWRNRGLGVCELE